MLTIELIQHAPKQNKVCIQFSHLVVNHLTQSTTENQKVQQCSSTVWCHTFIPTFVHTGQLAVTEKEERA
jgi:sulfur transfer protein SufE